MRPSVRERLKSHELKARKRFGQNFLVDEGILDAIVDGAKLTKEDEVLEIGPGLGVLTERLCEAAKSVRAVEIDRDLAAILKEELAHATNLTVEQADILDCEIERPYKVVANLPYYITTPILMKLLKNDVKPLSVTVMVQKELGLRMCASPGTKDYGALSLTVQYYAAPEWITDVPPTSFYPQPKVDSAVITLVPNAGAPVYIEDEEHCFELIRAAFSKRRKTLVNAVSSDPKLHHTAAEIREALVSMGISENVRGEALTLPEYAKLSGILKG